MSNISSDEDIDEDIGDLPPIDSRDFRKLVKLEDFMHQYSKIKAVLNWSFLSTILYVSVGVILVPLLLSPSPY